MAREASAERNTKETEIKLKINLDGTGYSDIEITSQDLQEVYSKVCEP